MLLSVVTFPQEPIALIKLDSIQAKPNTTINIPMYVDFTMGVGALDFYISYNDTVLSFLGIENSVAKNIHGVKYPQGGLILIAWYAQDLVPLTNSGKLLDLKFEYYGGETELKFLLSTNKSLYTTIASRLETSGYSFVSNIRAEPIPSIFQNGYVSELDDTKVYEISLDDFFVYPNPTKDYITIHYKYPVDKVKIINNMGQIVGVYNELNINVSNFKPGLYFVKIDNNTFKFIKE